MAVETPRRAFLTGYPIVRGLFVLAGIIAEAFAAAHTPAPVDLVPFGLALFFVAWL